MATRTITTHEHDCDLCGHPREARELAHLYGAPERSPYSGPRLDICEECQTRPIADVLVLLAARANTIHVRITEDARERTPEEIAELKERLERLQGERREQAA